jgi:Fic family protein
MKHESSDIKLIKPSFDSNLNEVIMDLEHLRKLVLRGNTPAQIFFQLKEIFHLLESMGSARIEGNRTTIADYIESKISAEAIAPDEDIKEISNIERALKFIDDDIQTNSEITHHFIKQLHQLTVDDLSINAEGDRTPGLYRQNNVRISGADHTPPDSLLVQSKMDELINFINRNDKPIYDLMKVAIAHHRFAWVHPFNNGNGRVVRLFTYALLMKFGFKVQVGGRVLNPTAVFCQDREMYYKMLSLADEGTDEGLEKWCTYSLGGIKEELNKVDKLTDHQYLTTKILNPALSYAREREFITKQEELILKFAAKIGEFKAVDLRKILPDLTPRQITYQINKLVLNRMICPIKENARSYVIDFSRNKLIRGVMKALEDEGFTSSLKNSE